MQYSQDSSLFAVATSIGIWIYDTNTFQELILLTDYSYGSDKVFGADSISFSQDGKILASVSIDGTLSLWDVATGEHKRTLGARKGTIWSVSFTPDGVPFAAEINNNVIYLWQVEKGTRKKVLIGQGSSVSHVTFSSDGRTLASTSVDGTVLFWNIASTTRATQKTE